MGRLRPKSEKSSQRKNTSNFWSFEVGRIQGRKEIIRELVFLRFLSEESPKFFIKSQGRIDRFRTSMLITISFACKTQLK